MAILDRVKSAWNAFRSTSNNEAVDGYTPDYGTSYATSSPSQPRRFIFNDRTIVTAIYNRISVDVADLPLRHVKLDDQGRYFEDAQSNLNVALTLDPNLDQTPRSLRQDIVMTAFDKGCAAVVPVDTAKNPQTNEVFDIFTLRVGEVVKWYPKHVRVSVYNEEKGKREEVTLEKRFVAIVENPLYSVMNEPNSTLQRLIRKLSLLDTVDEQNSSGKLDLIIQLPYTIRSEARKQQAEQRRVDIEAQLKGSKYGIAYTDATEKVTQLNRPVENNLLKQVEFLSNMLYGQLGITEEVMNGTADEAAMINYFNRTIKPIMDSIVEAMMKAFIGRQGAARREKITYFRDPFKLATLSQIAEIADKFTRNEIFSSNEIRGFMGVRPSDDPKADQLVNSNINPSVPGAVASDQETDDAVQSAFDDVDSTIDDVFSEFEDLGVA